MNNILSKVILFAAGAAVGSAVTWKLIKDKYERMALEDIEAVREFYSSKKQEVEEQESDETEEPEQPTARQEYEAFVKETGYGEVSTEKMREEEEDDMTEPYVISPSEFGECDYETETLWYYEGDGVVTNEFHEVVEDVEELVGTEFESHYGEYEEDSVFIRNDNMKTDFEILKDYRAYSEIS